MAKPKLLLIDDEPALGGFVAHAARASGYDVLITTESNSFRQHYNLHNPAAISLDLGIPGGDGVEMLRFLAGQKCTAPILIISGFDKRVLASAFSLGEAMGLRMVGPFNKPVRLQQLKETFAVLRNECSSQSGMEP